MKLEQGKYCPLIQKDCIGLQCSWFTEIRGVNPNTGQDVDEWGCAITWMPMLLIENSQQQRQTGAAVESFRNEVVRTNEENQKLWSSIISSTIQQEEIMPARIRLLNQQLPEVNQ